MFKLDRKSEGTMQLIQNLVDNYNMIYMYIHVVISGIRYSKNNMCTKNMYCKYGYYNLRDAF